MAGVMIRPLSCSGQTWLEMPWRSLLDTAVGIAGVEEDHGQIRICRMEEENRDQRKKLW